MESSSKASWSHVSLSLEQPGWPGSKKAEWVARAAGSELFRAPDLILGMDRLGAEGWELVTFAPETNDRAACYVFRRPRPDGP